MARKIELESATQLKAVSALMAIGNGATVAQAAKHAGITAAVLRSYRAKPWYDKAVAMASMAAPVREMRAAMVHEAISVTRQHMAKGSLKAAENTLKYIGVPEEPKTEIRIEDVDMSEKSNEELARLALPE